MADVDWAEFRLALRQAVTARGWSLSDAEAGWPGTNRAMLSRACNGRAVSTGTMLLLCRRAGLDPFAFLIEEKRRRHTLKSIADQPVTAGVSREAGTP